MDNLDGRLLKVVLNIISLPICHIFNLSLQEGLFPQVWKSAKVVPLPKKNGRVSQLLTADPLVFFQC